MLILLDCGTELQIEKTERGYQLGEVIKNEFKPLGQPHREFKDVISEILNCALAEYETLSLQEILDVITSTTHKIDDWFKLHNEYLDLVNLE